MNLLNQNDLKMLVCMLYGDGNIQFIGKLNDLRELAKRLDTVGVTDAIGVHVIEDGKEKIVKIHDAVKPGYINSEDKYSAYLPATPWLSLFGKAKLKSLLDAYTEEYASGTLITKGNILSCKRSLEVLPKTFGRLYDNHGQQFVVPDDFSAFPELRVYELVLYLKAQGHLEIIKVEHEVVEYQDFELNPAKSLKVYMTVKLLKTPKEIRDIQGYWEYYGDIRMNAADGVAFYKNTRYPAKSTARMAFKLLIKLVRNAGKKVLIDQVFDEIDGSDPGHTKTSAKYRKDHVEDWMKEVRKNLGFDKEKPPTICIMTIKDSVKLISTPPKKG